MQSLLSLLSLLATTPCIFIFMILLIANSNYCFKYSLFVNNTCFELPEICKESERILKQVQIGKNIGCFFFSLKFIL